MDSRLTLDETLAGILGLTEPDGDRHTYFNPPPSVRMRYPAIKYSLNNIGITFANNGAYRTVPSYEVVLIDEEADTPYLEKILQLPYCRFGRYYRADGLHHWTFTIYNH